MSDMRMNVIGEFTTKIKPELDDSAYRQQMETFPLALPPPKGSEGENFQAFTEATTDSTDSLKNNTAILKEFGDVMPEIIKNLRYMNSIVAQTNQSLPSIKRNLTSEEQKKKQLGAYGRQELLQLANSGSGMVQSFANGNTNGVILGGVNTIANTSNNLSKMADSAGLEGLAKGLVAGGVAAAIAGAAIKGVDALSDKFVEAMPTIYSTGRSFGSMSDKFSVSAYHELNKYNTGTGLDVDTFQGIAQSLRKQGVGNGLSQADQVSLVGNIAKTTSRWAYATGGDAGQYANLAAMMSRYGGSKNVERDFDYLMAAGKASGLNETQLPEFLDGIQKVMEDGIAKGFERSATDVADTLLMFSKMSGNNAFWQGNQGAKLLNQANSGLSNATSMSKTADILAYRAISDVYNSPEAQSEQLKDLYLSDGGYVNKMMLLEQGLNKDNFGAIMGSIASSTTSTEGQIERIRQMFGLNYSGASRMLKLYENRGKEVSEKDILDITEAPDYKNKELQNQQNINKIKDTVVRIGEGAASVKIAGMELVSNNIQKITNKILGDNLESEKTVAAKKEFSEKSVEEKRAVIEKIPTFATKDEKDAIITAYSEYNGIGMLNGVNHDNVYKDYSKGKLNKKIDLTILEDYLNKTYGNEILDMFGGDKEKTLAFIERVGNGGVKSVWKQAQKESKDKTITQDEKSEMIKLLQQLVDQVSSGITLNQLK